MPLGFAASEWPADCHRYDSFRAHLQRRFSNKNINDDADQEEAARIAFQGMTPHDALGAIRAREHGLPHHAQIQRRLTSRSNPQKPESNSSWFY